MKSGSLRKETLNNYKMAEIRFTSLVRRMKGDTKLDEQYHKILDEHLDIEIVSYLEKSSDNPIFYYGF